MDITISIVSYKTKDLLRRCLQSIYRQAKEVDFEIVVVDNASSDGSVAMVKKEFPKVRLIKNKENKFFTRAHNQSLKIAKGKYFLLLNSDTYFIDNAIKKLVLYMEKNREVGAIDGLEMHEDGSVISTGSKFSTPLIDFYELSLIGKRIANKKKVNNYRIKNHDRKKTFPIDVACDAFLCSRTKLLKELKGYDEHYLLYYTENDLCYRIKQKGYKIFHVGDIKVIHRVSSSVKKLGWKKLDIYYSDMLYYYRKHGYSVSRYALFFLLKIEEYLLKIFRPNMNT